MTISPRAMTPLYQPLERALLIVDAVIGGDERDLRPARGQQGAPCRGAAARMEKIDTMLGDQLFQSPRIGKHRQRAFRGGRKMDRLAADADQLAAPAARLRSPPAPRPPAATVASATSITVRSAPPAARAGMT